MRREEYLEKRTEMLNQAKAATVEGKLDDFEAVKRQIEELDAKFELEAKAEANFAALEKGVIVPKTAVGLGVGTKSEDEDDEAATDTYKTAFLKAMMHRGLNDAEKKSFAAVNGDALMNAGTQTAANHPAVIPVTMMREIWSEMAEQHPIIADSAASRTYVRGKVTIPAADVSGDGEWYDEATATVPSAITSANIELDGHELAKAVTISWKLYEMSLEDFEAFLRRKLAEKMGNAIATAFVTGPGIPGQGDTFKPQPLGVITALEAETSTPQIINYTAANGISYANLTAGMGALISGYVSGAAIYAKSTTIWTLLANILDTTKRPIFVPDVTAGGVGRMFGIPVKAEDAVPAGKVLGGNYARGYVSNVNRDVEILTEDHVLARTTDYSAYAIIDGKPMTTKAFFLIEPST